MAPLNVQLLMLFECFLLGDDILDRRCASRRLFRQQPPGPVRRHGRVQRPVTGQVAESLSAFRQAADRIQGLRY